MVTKSDIFEFHYFLRHGACSLLHAFNRRSRKRCAGVGHNRNTYLHVIDEILDIEGRLEDKPFEAIIKDKDGKVYKIQMYKHKGTYSEFSQTTKQP